MQVKLLSYPPNSIPEDPLVNPSAGTKFLMYNVFVELIDSFLFLLLFESSK